MSGFVDFADVKARCSIEQAAKLLGLQCTEERAQLRALCPACGNGGPRAIVITPAKNLFHCFFESGRRSDSVGFSRRESKGRSGLNEQTSRFRRD
jgi:hypothetical protein